MLERSCGIRGTAHCTPAQQLGPCAGAQAARTAATARHRDASGAAGSKPKPVAISSCLLCSHGPSEWCIAAACAECSQQHRRRCPNRPECTERRVGAPHPCAAPLPLVAAPFNLGAAQERVIAAPAPLGALEAALAAVAAMLASARWSIGWARGGDRWARSRAAGCLRCWV